MLATAEGRRVGFVSGGCLERELVRLAWPATEHHPATLTFDTRGRPTQPGGRYNAGCEGCLHVLCERLTPEAIAPLRPFAEALSGEGNPAGPVTTAVAYASDDPAVSVGTRQFAETATTLQPAFRGIDRNYSVDVTTAAGEVSVFVETVRPPRRLVLLGAGDDAQPLARMASLAGHVVTVLSPKAELLTAERFPEVRRLVGPLRETFASLSLDTQTAVVLMTHSFADDAAVLPVALRSPASYVGLLGPKRRLGRLVQDIAAADAGFDALDWSRLRSPVGLDLGAVTPEEIAVSILAEIIAIDHGRTGESLHERAGAIHEPHRHLPAPASATA